MESEKVPPARRVRFEIAAMNGGSLVARTISENCRSELRDRESMARAVRDTAVLVAKFNRSALSTVISPVSGFKVNRPAALSSNWQA